MRTSQYIPLLFDLFRLVFSVTDYPDRDGAGKKSEPDIACYGDVDDDDRSSIHRVQTKYYLFAAASLLVILVQRWLADL